MILKYVNFRKKIVEKHNLYFNFKIPSNNLEVFINVGNMLP